MEHSNIDATLTVLFKREDNTIVAYCPDLELSSHGDTLEEAKKNFAEVLDIFLDDLIQRGTLEQVLWDCGWQKLEDDDETEWQPPVYIARESIPIHRII